MFRFIVLKKLLFLGKLETSNLLSLLAQWISPTNFCHGYGLGWGLDGAWMGLGWGLDGAWMGLGWGLDGAWMGLGWGLDGAWMGLGWGLDGAWMGLGWCLDGAWMGLGWGLDSAWMGDKSERIIFTRSKVDHVAGDL